MNVFELFGTIAINNRDANASLKDTATKAEKTGKQIQEAFKKIGSTSIKIGKTVIGAATAISTAFVATVESTRDYRTAMAKLETAFVTNGHSADTAYETYKKLQRVLGDTDQATEAANHLAKLCETEEELDRWTDICTGVYATFGDSLPIESMTEAANETAKTGELTGALADALNWAGIKEDEFQLKLNACRTEEDRAKLITDELTWAYKGAADQYETTGESVMKANEAQEKLNGAMSKLGEIGEPILTGVKGWIADMVLSAVPHLESIVSSFSNLEKTWTEEVWPAIQKDWKMNFGIDLPDWETFKANVIDGWEKVKTEISNSFIVNAIIDIPKNWSQMAADIATGWDSIIWPAIKEKYKATFGVDMPTWTDIAAVIANGWEEVIWPAIKEFYKITFNVDMPSWSDITASIKAGWESVKASIAGLFNIDIGYGIGSGKGITITEQEHGATGSFASGLDYVPHDGFIARVHKGEAILNSAQASEWRGGGGNVEALLSQIAANTGAGKSIVLDSGVLVGQLAPGMDAQLGTIMNRKRRGG